MIVVHSHLLQMHLSLYSHCGHTWWWLCCSHSQFARKVFCHMLPLCACNTDCQGACACVCLCRNSSSNEPQHETESPKGVPWQGTSQSTQDPDNFCTAVAAGCPWLYTLTREQRPLLWWHVHLDKVFFFACCCHICLRSVGIMEVHSWHTFNLRVMHHGRPAVKIVMCCVKGGFVSEWIIGAYPFVSAVIAYIIRCLFCFCYALLFFIRNVDAWILYLLICMLTSHAHTHTHDITTYSLLKF